MRESSRRCRWSSAQGESGQQLLNVTPLFIAEPLEPRTYLSAYLLNSIASCAVQRVLKFRG